MRHVFNQGDKVIIVNNTLDAPNRYNNTVGIILEVCSDSTVDVKLGDNKSFWYMNTDIIPYWELKRRV